jgi:peptide/nickel transport system substrate-binding protein
LFRRFAGQDALLHALDSGEVDVTGALGQDRIEAVRQAPGLALDSKTGVNLAFLSLNNERAPLSDRRVRQALARRAGPQRARARGARGPRRAGAQPAAAFAAGILRRGQGAAARPAAARQLLREAGLEAGFETTLLAVDTPRPTSRIRCR